MTRDDDARAGCSGPAIVLYGAEHLVPRGLERAELNAWLAAPLAGAPLYQRMLEPLAGLRPSHLWVLDSGPQARALSWLLVGPSVLGRRAELVTHARLDDCSLDDAVLFPVGMLICGSEDLGSRLVAALDPPAHRVLLCLAEPSASGQHLLTSGLTRCLPSNELIGSADFVGALAAAKRGGDTPILCGSLRAYRTDDPGRLLDLARAALSEHLFAPVGEFRDGLLVGNGATVSKRAKVEGAAAVGVDSYVAPGAILCEGTIVGERCHIGEGAFVSDSLVLDGSHVAAGDVVLSAVRGPNGEIGV